MTIKCFACRHEVSVPDWIHDGQHVQCPYCNCKFQWRTRRRCSAKPSSLIKLRCKKILMMSVIGFSILIVVTLWFTRDWIQYCMAKRWYAVQLKQGGLSELSFDYDPVNNAGSLLLSGGTSLSSISWSPYHMNYPRSMSEYFVRRVINARKAIERYETNGMYNRFPDNDCGMVKFLPSDNTR